MDMEEKIYCKEDDTYYPKNKLFKFIQKSIGNKRYYIYSNNENDNNLFCYIAIEADLINNFFNYKFKYEPDIIPQLYYNVKTNQSYTINDIYQIYRNQEITYTTPLGNKSKIPIPEEIIWISLLNEFKPLPYNFILDNPFYCNEDNKEYRTWEIINKNTSFKSIVIMDGKKEIFQMYASIKTIIDYYTLESDTQFNPPHEEANPKYYFNKKSYKSYTLLDIYNLAQNLCYEYITPMDNNAKIRIPNRILWAEIYKNFNRPSYIPYDFIIDQSRTNGDKLCPLSQEEYNEPHILSLNGRSYSLEDFLNAVESTLYKGSPLRLEDTTILVDMLNGKGITLYPNKSLGATLDDHIVLDPEKIELKRFDENLVYKNNIKCMSDIIKNVPKNSNEMWDYMAIWKSYAKERGFNQEWAGLTVSIEDIIIKDQTLPNLHPKCDSGHIIFKNCLFKNCTIDIKACWCGFDIKSSMFLNCKMIFPDDKPDIDIYGPNYQNKISYCEMDECQY